VLFHEAIEEFDREDLEERFRRFERAGAKGHEESIWIWSVVKDVEMEHGALKEAFAKTEQPLGWYFAGELSRRREQFEYYKKSAEGGCSWGQAGYGVYFRDGRFVEKDEKVYLEWLEKRRIKTIQRRSFGWEIGIDRKERMRRRHCSSFLSRQSWAGKPQCVG
jgi:hypothetical protein